jgi:sugar/nucleoside kinase (ribokinase family)
MDTQHIRVSDDYATSVSYVFNDPTGERTIVMAPASTSQLKGDKMEREFAQVVPGAGLVTTEVSQVRSLPPGKLAYPCITLHLAAAAVWRGMVVRCRRPRWHTVVTRCGRHPLRGGAHSFPALCGRSCKMQVQVGAARLGSRDELRRVVGKATVLKLTASAAPELLDLAKEGSGQRTGPDRSGEGKLAHLTQQLGEAFGARMCVVTDGSRGSALAQGGKGQTWISTEIPVFKGVQQRDATGGSQLLVTMACQCRTLGLCRCGRRIFRWHSSWYIRLGVST